jgi:hypothetical protein
MDLLENLKSFFRLHFTTLLAKTQSRSKHPDNTKHPETKCSIFFNYYLGQFNISLVCIFAERIIKCKWKKKF